MYIIMYVILLSVFLWFSSYFTLMLHHDIWIFVGCIGLTIFEISPTVGFIRRHFTRQFSFAPSYCFSLSTCSQSRFQNVDFLFCGGGGQGAGDREKRGREVYGRREKKGREAGEKGKNYATLRSISQSKKCKGVGAKKYRAGTGFKGYGKLEV